MDSRGPIEVALSTDFRSEPYYFSLWDIYTGTQLVVFKGNKGNPISRCLKFIDGNYFITATDNVINIWSIFNKKSQEQKLFLPARPSVLNTSPCGNYLIAGIAEMIYVWQLCSGNLLASAQRHYQTVTVLKFDQDGTFLFSGGEDGAVLVWPFADLISGTHNSGSLNLKASSSTTGVNEPRYSWQNHNAPVTDIHITASGLCVTTSTDKTVNIYSYSTGARVHCITDLPTPICSVAMDRNETKLFLGGQDGNIYQVLTSSLSLSQLYSRNSQASPTELKLSGHRDKVTQLSVSMDGSMLISGSLDSFCKVWDIIQGKLLRDVKHQAPVSNLTTLVVPDAFSLTTMTQSQVKPPLNVKPLKRNLYKTPRTGSIMRSELFEESSTTILYLKNTTETKNWISEEVSLIKVPSSSDIVAKSHLNHADMNGTSQTDDASSSSELRVLKSRLRELYLLAAEKIFKDVAHESLQPFKGIVDEIVDESSPAISEKKSSTRNNLDIISSTPKLIAQINYHKNQLQNGAGSTELTPNKIKEAPNPDNNSGKKLKKDSAIFV